MFFSSRKKITIENLYPWQKACLEKIEEFLQPYYFSPAFYGLYLYGPPGRGKTYLMDTLAQHDSSCHRLHFFSLCAHLQEMLHQGKNQHFDSFFNDVSRRDFLLIDEIIIEDIADAMLFAQWFDQVQKRKIRLLMTSNIECVNHLGYKISMMCV